MERLEDTDVVEKKNSKIKKGKSKNSPIGKLTAAVTSNSAFSISTNNDDTNSCSNLTASASKIANSGGSNAKNKDANSSSSTVAICTTPKQAILTTAKQAANHSNSVDAKRFESLPGVTFKAKLIGIEDVPEARGEKMCQVAMAKLKAAVIVIGEHKEKIVLSLSYDGLRLYDEKQENVLQHQKISVVTFIARDMGDARAFGYVFQTNLEDGIEGTTIIPKYRYVAVKTEKSAEPVVACIKQLFISYFEKSQQQQQQQRVEDEDKSSDEDGGEIEGEEEAEEQGDEVATEEVETKKDGTGGNVVVGVVGVGTASAKVVATTEVVVLKPVDEKKKKKKNKIETAIDDSYGINLLNLDAEHDLPNQNTRQLILDRESSSNNSSYLLNLSPGIGTNNQPNLSYPLVGTAQPTMNGSMVLSIPTLGLQNPWATPRNSSGGSGNMDNDVCFFNRQQKFNQNNHQQQQQQQQSVGSVFSKGASATSTPRGSNQWTNFDSPDQGNLEKALEKNALAVVSKLTYFPQPPLMTKQGGPSINNLQNQQMLMNQNQQQQQQQQMLLNQNQQQQQQMILNQNQQQLLLFNQNQNNDFLQNQQQQQQTTLNQQQFIFQQNQQNQNKLFQQNNNHHNHQHVQQQNASAFVNPNSSGSSFDKFLSSTPLVAGGNRGQLLEPSSSNNPFMLNNNNIDNNNNSSSNSSGGQFRNHLHPSNNPPLYNANNNNTANSCFNASSSSSSSPFNHHHHHHHDSTQLSGGGGEGGGRMGSSNNSSSRIVVPAYNNSGGLGNQFQSSFLGNALASTSLSLSNSSFQQANNWNKQQLQQQQQQQQIGQQGQSGGGIKQQTNAFTPLNISNVEGYNQSFGSLLGGSLLNQAFMNNSTFQNNSSNELLAPFSAPRGAGGDDSARNFQQQQQLQSQSSGQQQFGQNQHQQFGSVRPFGDSSFSGGVNCNSSALASEGTGGASSSATKKGGISKQDFGARDPPKPKLSELINKSIEASVVSAFSAADLMMDGPLIGQRTVDRNNNPFASIPNNPFA